MAQPLGLVGTAAKVEAGDKGFVAAESRFEPAVAVCDARPGNSGEIRGQTTISVQAKIVVCPLFS